MARSPRSPLPFPSLLRALSAVLLAALAALAGAGCDDSSSSVFEGGRTFWAVDFTIDNNYQVRARLAATGDNCYVYVEEGREIDDATARAVAKYFDDNVYLQLRNAFGEEPNPAGRMNDVVVGGVTTDVAVGDADRDPRVYLLLLDIRDGFRPGVGSAVLGYFYSRNEDPGAYKDPSNTKEILFLDVYPGQVGSDGVLGEEFKRTVAHEFQHMIHWEQKTNRTFRILRGLDRSDDTWLNEAMSMVAPAFCGLGSADPAGPSVDRAHLAIFERSPTDSLTEWAGSSADYAVTYAWAEFLREHCSDDAYYDANTASGRLVDNTVFRTILGNDRGENPDTGIRSVDAAFGSAPDNTFVFLSLFRNWSVASFYGDGRASRSPVVPPGDTVRYLLFDTWRTMPDGTWNMDLAGLALLGCLNQAAPLNQAVLPALPPWSFGVFRYDGDVPSPSNPGTVRWLPTDNNHTASFVDGGSGTLLYDLPRDNTARPYTGQAWLVVRNDQDVPLDPRGVDNVFWLSREPSPRSPLAAVEGDPGARLVSEKTGKPYGLCVQSWLEQRKRRLGAFPTR